MVEATAPLLSCLQVTVAKGIEGPIKLLFPRVANATTAAARVVASAATDAAPAAAEAVAGAVAEAAAVVAAETVPAAAKVTNFSGEALEFSMLGLGDIVIPGFFMALLLRFDAEQAKADPLEGAGGSFPKPYFRAVMAAYVAGLAVTVLVMEVFKAAQPALLYLVPATLGAAVGTGLWRGELQVLFAYDEEAPEGAPEGMPEGTPEGTSEGTSKGTPKGTPEGATAVIEPKKDK